MSSDYDYNDAAQLERTVLAWNRSSLALAANGALVARAGFARNLIPLDVLGFAVVVLGAALWFLSSGRYSAAIERLESGLVAGRHTMLAAGLFVAGLSAVDLALVTTS